MTEVFLHIDAGAGDDVVAADQAVRRLRDEIARCGVEEVCRVRARSGMIGAKGPGMDTVGQLVITLAGSSVLASIVAVLKSWIERDGRRTAEVQVGDDTLKLTNVSDHERDRLVEAFLARHDPS
jgi:hypothetical protein